MRLCVLWRGRPVAVREEAGITRDAGEIISQLAIIIKNAQMHDPQNAVVVASIDRFVVLTNDFVDAHGACALELMGDFFYVDRVRIRYATEHLLNYEFLVREFKRRELGSVSVHNRVRAEDVRTFLGAVIASAFVKPPFQKLAAEMATVSSLTVGPLKKASHTDEEFDVRKMVKRTYFNAVSFTKGVVSKIKSGEKINVRRAKRVVESMVDLILDQEDLLFGMTAIKDYDEYTYHHSVNVSILSVALGHRLGLNRKALTEVGLVALFHDVGKIDVPPEILNKPTNFNEEEWQVIRRHPLSGARTIMNLRGFDQISARAVIVAFEHHLNLDMSGYPAVRGTFSLDLYSRIVSIADHYDAMTSARVYLRVPMSPAKALGIMMEQAGTQLDPLLLKFLVNMIGTFPLGTLVLLDTKELGLVCGTGAVMPDRPKVLIVVDSEGRKSEGRHIDLSEKDEQGRYLRTIVKTVDPHRYRISTGAYFLSGCVAASE
jgi:HD-GYP domain-containing protein (c-di-GMP phosphodiesterase class II)